MYKWGFFILLGVNAYTSVNYFFPKSSIKEKVYVKIDSNEQVRDLAQEPKTLYVKPLNSVKQTLPPTKHTIDLEGQVKERLLERFIEKAKAHYSYFFEYNSLSPEQEEKVTLILAEGRSSYGDCLGSDSPAGVLRKRLGNAGLDFSEIQHVMEFLDKEWTYNGLQNVGVNFLNIRGNVVDLVDEIDAYYETLDYSKFAASSSLEDDPFADSDPFAEVDPFKEDQSELDIQIELREGILQIINQLQKEGLEAYDDQVNILSKYTDVTDEIKLELLQKIGNY